MRYLNDWIWLRLSNRYNVTSATHSLTDVYDRWLRSVPSSLGVDLVDFYRQRVPDAETLNDAEYIYWSGGPLQDAVLWLDAQSVTTGHTTVPNLGSGGSVLNAQYGNGSTASTFPTLLEHTGENYVYFPGLIGNTVTTPAVAYNLTGDVELIVHTRGINWSDTSRASIVSSWSGGFLFDRFNGTTLLFGTSLAHNHYMLPPHGLTGVQDQWFRCRYIKATGNLTVDRSADGTNWINLATAPLGVTPGVNFPNFVAALTVGGINATGFMEGRVSLAEIRNGIGGPAVVRYRDSDIVSGSQTSWVSSTGETWTINRATSGRKTVAVTRPVWLFGTDDYLEVADNDLLDFGATDSFTVMAVARRWPSVPVGGQRLVSKRLTTGYVITVNASNQLEAYIQGSSGFGQTQIGSVTGGVLSTFVGVFAPSTVQAYLNNTVASGSNTSTGGSATALALNIGREPGGGLHADMELFAVAVWRRALTAAEIAQVVQYYGLSSVPSWAHLVLDEEGVPILDENGDVIETE